MGAYYGSWSWCGGAEYRVPRTCLLQGPGYLEKGSLRNNIEELFRLLYYLLNLNLQGTETGKPEKVYELLDCNWGN